MSKSIKTILAIIIILGLGGAITYFVMAGMKEDPIGDLVKYSYESPEITTDLNDGSFVRIQFQIVTDGKEAKEELAQREFQLRNILIKELILLSEDEFKTELTKIEKAVKERLNKLMTKGEIIEVYTISKILQ